MRVVVVETGVANTASVRAALLRAGAEVELSRDPERIRAASHVVLPGVGAFAAGMAALRGLEAALRERIAADRPTLAVCLGLQLLAGASDESPGVAGLGVLEGTVRRLVAPRVPHLGWNAVGRDPADGLLAPGVACFANSYALTEAPAGWRALWADHGAPFVAAVERGRVVACQFHPELSGDYGAALIRRWLAGEAVAGGGATGRLLRRVIPCLDVRGGRVVKGVQFQGLRDAGDPAERAALYAAQGADEIVVLDVSATPEERGTAVDTVGAVRRVLGVPLTVGGGVRSTEDAARLLGAGADKVGVNSAAVADPSLLDALATRFGRQCVVIAIDAAKTASGYDVVVRSGTTRTGRDAVDWAREAADRGAGEILLTSWDRDGTQAGYDLELTAAIASAVPVPVIASGGASGAEHLAAAYAAGADAALIASILHDGHTTVGDLKARLAAMGVEIR